jgi:hypothetical protein
LFIDVIQHNKNFVLHVCTGNIFKLAAFKELSHLPDMIFQVKFPNAELEEAFSLAYPADLLQDG